MIRLIPWFLDSQRNSMGTPQELGVLLHLSFPLVIQQLSVRLALRGLIPVPRLHLALIPVHSHTKRLRTHVASISQGIQTKTRYSMEWYGTVCNGTVQKTLQWEVHKNIGIGM